MSTEIDKLIEEKIASGESIEDAKIQVAKIVENYGTGDKPDDQLSQVRACLEKGDVDGAKVLLNLEGEAEEGEAEKEDTIVEAIEEDKNIVLEELNTMENAINSDKIDRESKLVLLSALNDIHKKLTGDK